MWAKRSFIWEQIKQTPQWDVIVVGGGITGAGILREASRAGLRVLLVEQRDFAWGTSSRSSKMVHGGLRYLSQGQIGVTFQSVRERQNLLAMGEGLVKPLGFLIPTYQGDSRTRFFGLGLLIYDLMAQRWDHRSFNPQAFSLLAPRVKSDQLSGGFYFEDAQTDDARLVLRILQEAVADGGVALNYARAEGLMKDEAGQVCGIRLCDAETGHGTDVFARVVINATGAWVDGLRHEVSGVKHIRPLRGSHLIFPSWRFPVAQAVTFAHPANGRPVFAFPWEGVTLVGTTDLDHDLDLNTEPHISGEEVAYLLAACNAQFPALELTPDDVISTYAGVRPVIDTGKADPSKESREHVVWQENGLLSVTGGKLTTFRVIALDALRTALPDVSFDDHASVLNPLNASSGIDQRLLGRYAANAEALIAVAQPDELKPIGNTSTLWAELRWAARAEAVEHLDDLLLRRTRIGLLLPEGGKKYLPRIRAICKSELNWDEKRWQREINRYNELWAKYYSLPPRDTIPDWHELIPAETPIEAPSKWRYVLLGLSVVLLVLMLIRISRRTAESV